MFTEKDLQTIRDKGIEIEKIKGQLTNFEKGFSPAQLVAAATPDHGIVQFSDQKIQKLEKEYETLIKGKKVLKFVPASGAASRMFKHLFEFKDQYSPEKEAELFSDKGFNSVFNFFDNIDKFAFHADLSEALISEVQPLKPLVEKKKFKEVISALLDKDGLNYAALPKGLLKFHKYGDHSRMSIEEHLVEGAVYSKDEHEDVRIHFTVSPEHMEKFKEAIREKIHVFESDYNVSLKVSFSIQKPSTDIIAVDLNNRPYRNNTDELVFRPGGHGALIENLNELEANIIFIKNIDNVVPDKLRATTYTFKKVIASHLINLQNQIFEYLEELDHNPDADLLEEITTFAKERLFIDFSNEFSSRDEKVKFLKEKLNRPIRICGMVKNEGEPGGGPFWVKNQRGKISLQIVESSQMNLNIPEQKEIVNKATHFNPVDLVCGVYDYKGNKFDLTKYVDPNTGFISEKSQNGKTLKAQELPGLWNGAMADWITIFVECPIITFNPVKTVNDLLREQHQ